jgi:hypothetical protein
MYRAVMLLIAITFAPSAALAQQPCTTNAQQVVNELYRHMLERQADAGSAVWVQQLQGGRTVRAVVRDIATSEEHMQRFWRQESGEDTPYLRAVGTFYRHILGRQPDAAGARSWATQANRRGMDTIVDQIVNSTEYDQQFGDWGVPGSGGLRYCGVNNQGAAADPAFRPRGRGFGRGSVNRFENIDVNGNNRIEAREWRGSVAQFNRLDINNDDVVTRAEFTNTADVDDSAVATSGEFVRVEANQPWTDTGITVRAGDTITFDAQGTVRLSNSRNDIAGAGGTLSNRREADSPLPNQVAGALIARIGNSPPLFIGNRRAVRAPFGGRLYLGVNEDYLADNTGDFQVAVTVDGR